jgi:F420H(2)-dependent quinone reductase
MLGLLQQAFQRVHRWLYVATDGRLGHRLAGVPALILTTTGRRSGQPRLAVLTYAPDGQSYLVVASNDGRDEPPAWLGNVGADPAVRVQVGRLRGRATATIVAAEDQGYERLWRLVNANNHRRYEGYQRRTARPIPIVALTPSEPLR